MASVNSVNVDGKQNNSEVIIIGAGIVGIATAAVLSEAGHSVLIVDRTGICEETSSGNAAALAFSEVLPLASKGVMKKVPGWLMDPLGPFAIRPSYLLKLLPWLYRFWRASSPSALRNSTVVQGQMMQLAEREMLALAERAGVTDMIHHEGNLELYESEAELQAAMPGWEAKKQAGIDYTVVRGAELAALQPGLSPRFVVGCFVPKWKNVSDPKLYGKALWAYAEKLGSRYRQGVVTNVAHVQGGAEVTLADGGELQCKKLIVAAGAWSHHLSAQLGDAVPLETERGYNTTLPVGAYDIRRQLTFPGHAFVITPLTTGVRVGGAVELGGLTLPPNYARSEAMLKKAKQFLPQMNIEGGRQWMGYRPSTPDTLPVIGYSSASNDIVYAFGHGHLGLTQSAATARLVTQLLNHETTALPVSAFSPKRF
ncbi:FAD-binding oxidoreductase [Ochrobactrum sp. SFR4]|uniref:NAD(P)/FAD-dependent oxidoreductase n=1 Tax=Ochrobactrum sp. SFR4 TaxID=2717368 RepID=UPI001C8C3D5F|nr:FAD-binding oxidoreductase [Ochrobactrum sp. SFR4]MBX8826332.1 FAD-binding oxidoreductase [Ochrobactrum sp. SFR4]